MLLDSLLWMGAVSALAWYFFLAPLYLQSHQSLAGKVAALTYVVGDLVLLFGYILTLLRTVRRYQPALVILLFACLAVLFGDASFAYLSLQGLYVTEGVPDVFWNIATVLVPLAAVVQLCLIPREPLRSHRHPAQVPLQQPIQHHIRLEIFRFLAPLAAALFASAVIAIRAIFAPVFPLSPLAPSLVIFGLLLLVLLRQGIMVLEHAQWWREREEAQARVLTAQASEQAVRETNRQMETFLGIISHELKTPLTSMLLSLQMLQRRAQAPPQVKARMEGARAKDKISPGLEVLVQQHGRLSRLVNDLVDISRIQAGRLEVHAQRTDLAALVDQVVEEHRLVAPERTIHCSRPGEGPVLVCADAERVGQVVTNYLSNALKFSSQECPVEVGVLQDGQQGRVWVRDQGPGIPLEEQASIWERFHQAAGVTVQCGSGIGLGLGLHISKSIIEQLHGQVGAESLPGQGATFWFTLPLAGPPGAAVPEEDTGERVRG